MLELRSNVPDPYIELFSCLLNPVLWDRAGNIHPLVRLLQAYIEKGADRIIQMGKLVSVLLISL